MREKIKRFKQVEQKNLMKQLLWFTIIAAIIMGFSIFTKNGTVMFFTVLIYISLLCLAIGSYFETLNEIENRLLIKTLIQEGQAHINLNCCDSERITIEWIESEDLYSVTLHNFYDKYSIKYRQENQHEGCIVNRRIEIDDDLTVTVIG